jgi:hypothetical protein
MAMIETVVAESQAVESEQALAAGSDGAGDDGTHGTHGGEQSRHERWIQIGEAILLAVITVVTAWSGFHGARWETVAKLSLSRSTAYQQQANDAYTVAQENRALDASNFQVWFTAYTQHNQAAADVAVRRFRAEFKVAFGAWMATDPFTNPSAPPGPLAMPEYSMPNDDRAVWLDARSATYQHIGNQAGGYGDEYVRLTLMLAGVLFLVAISNQFKMVATRYGLLVVGFLGLVSIVGLLTTLPFSH